MSATIALIVLWSAGAAPVHASATTPAPSRSESRQAAGRTAVERGGGVMRRVDWSAGPVARWSGYSRSDGSVRVRAVQRTLRRLHYRPGPVDGLFGPRTERAVVRFQRAEALAQDGVVGRRTLRRLDVRGAEQRPPASSPTRPKLAPVPKAGPPPSATAAPANRGPGRGVIVLVALLGLLVALLGLLAFGGALAARRGHERRAAAATAIPAALPAGPLAPAPEPQQERTQRDAIGDGVPSAGPGNGSSGESRAPGSRLGELLRDAGVLSRGDLSTALHEQERSGGRLGEILTASGTIAVPMVTEALARQLRMETLRHEDRPVALLEVQDARAWRAVALDGSEPERGDVAVAMTDPNADVLAQLEATLGGRVEPRLTDEATLDELLRCVYADSEADEVTRTLREEVPEFSAYRTALSKAQMLGACALGFVLAVGLLTHLLLTATVFVGIATAFFVISTSFRLYAAWEGFGPGATINPSDADLDGLDERALPVYTILLPLYKEKPSTVRALFDALARIDYPKHKLDGLLLIEDDDEQTISAIERVGPPAWMRPLPLPAGVPRTKPRAMGIGLRYARGTLVTVYDAEDKPDPLQLKKAAWGFQRVDASVACLQAKLGYYNPRQNLLTRWFTLEYDAWFNIFLPGLHRIGAPIPLGGTSNHFRRGALEACLGWDPYNVTEDADLGLRFARLGLTTAMLESTTGEEANSRVPNWLRQRSRWSKGYMQTLLVHTRRPLRLLRELGPRATASFLLTIGGAVVTALLAPIFWMMLLLWIYLQPVWIAELFPGPIYYAASVSLVAGNFLLVFLSLCAAVGRGHDDLAPHALLIPCYWVLMSTATYVALFELLLRPHHWHKTEHGLHLAEEPS